MEVFTFVCRYSKGKWNAKQLNGDIEMTTNSTYALQRLLVQAIVSDYCSGGVQSSFSYVLPNSAVFQVIVDVGPGPSFDCCAAGGACRYRHLIRSVQEKTQ